MLEHCDSVCIGEAEEVWPKIINDFLNDNHQKPTALLKLTDLKNLPIPQWNYISKKDYLYHNIVVTSRGCPFKCEFCYNSCNYIQTHLSKPADQRCHC